MPSVERIAYTGLPARRAAALITFMLISMLAVPQVALAKITVPKKTTVIKVVAPTRAHSKPTGGKTLLRLKPTEEWGGPTQLRVLKRRRIGTVDGEPRYSYKVLLNKRPNRSKGWVKSDRVTELSTPWAIHVDLSQRKVRVFKKGKLRKSMRAVVGKRSTPTPRGSFYVNEVIKRRNPREFSGSWVITFAYSNVLQQFAGGPGRVAMHGRGGRSLRDPLGTARSNGCVRLNNRAINWIANNVEEGAPLIVVR